MDPLIRRILALAATIVFLFPMFIGAFKIYAEQDIAITYKTVTTQKDMIIVEFSVDNTYVGNFKLRASPTFDRPFAMFVEYDWTSRRLINAIGHGAYIDTFVIIYQIDEGNETLATGAIYSSSSSKIVNLPKLVMNPEELARYDIKKLQCIAPITKSGRTVGVVVVDFLQELDKAGIDELFFIESLEKHTLTLKSEVKDMGWIETEISRGVSQAGLIRFVGDPHFRDTRLFYVNLQMFEYDMSPFYKLHLDMTLVDTESYEERRLNYTLKSGEEFFMPGTITLADLGVTEYLRVKSYNVTSFILTLENPIETRTVNITDMIGIMSFKAVAGTILISNMELKHSGELGNGWYYWQVSAQIARKLTNAEVLLITSKGSVKPVFVKVVSHSSDKIGDSTFIIDVLGLFNQIGKFDGNITVRTVLDNFEVRDYNLHVISQISNVSSQTKEAMDVSNVTSLQLIEKIQLEIHRRENLLRYGLVSDVEEKDFIEALEELKEELAKFSPSENYMEYTFPIEKKLGKYDYLTLSYQYVLKPSNNKAVEISYVFDIQDEGYREPFRILGASFQTTPTAEYWFSSFLGPKYIFKQLGSENLAAGYAIELYDAEGTAVDYNYVKSLSIRFLNVDSVNISNVTLNFHKVNPPEDEFPYAYQDDVSEVLASRNVLLKRYSERGSLLWVLFAFSAIMVAYNVVVMVRSKRI